MIGNISNELIENVSDVSILTQMTYESKVWR